MAPSRSARPSRLSAFGVAGARGGTFAFEAPRLEIVARSEWATGQRVDLIDPDLDPDADPAFFSLGDSLFSGFGFASFDLAATGPRGGEQSETLAVRTGANVDARAYTLFLEDGVGRRASGGDVLDFARAALAPDYQRTATNLALRVEPRFNGADGVGSLTIERDSQLRVDARGSVNLTSVGGINVSGSIVAPGGNFTAQILNPAEPNEAGYLADLGISFFGPTSVDVAGISLMRPNDAGLLQGEVLAGGSVNLLANRGFIAASREATFDMRGGSSFFDLPSARGGYEHRQIGGAGGRIDAALAGVHRFRGAIARASRRRRYARGRRQRHLPAHTSARMGGRHRGAQGHVPHQSAHLAGNG